MLRQDRTGGVVLMVATGVALGWANGAGAGYEAFQRYQVGPSGLHLDLSLGQWAADGLLAIFFFVAGLELKRECVEGDLRHLPRAVLPVVAAVGGMACPALIYLLISWLTHGAVAAGWAIPTPTDIAFAVAVLALVGSRLPSTVRTFLLALAVVDDVLAITIIAVFYTDHLSWRPLVAALVGVAVFAWLARRRVAHWWLLAPVALGVWSLMHASGVHATVAGVLLGVVVPVALHGPAEDRPHAEGRDPLIDGDHLHGRAQHWEHYWRPISAGVAVPLFALTSAGVNWHGAQGLMQALGSPVALAITVGLVVGKPLGIVGATLLTSVLFRVRLPGFGQAELIGVALLAGMGFTVSLLLTQLSFPTDPAVQTHAKVAVVVGSLLAASLGALVLLRRNQLHAVKAQAR